MSAPEQTVVVQKTRRGAAQNALLMLTAAIALPLLLLATIVLNDVRYMIGQARSVVTFLTTADPDREMGPGSLAITRTADAVSRMSPERQEELRNSLEMLSLKLAPIVQGARPLVEALSAPPPPPAPQQ